MSSSSGTKFAWGFLRYSLGILLWSAALVLLFVLFDGALHMPMWLAWTLAALAMLVVPSLLTRLLQPAFRRIGEDPKWFELWPGLCVVVALLTLLGVPFFARDFTAQRLMRVQTQYRSLPPAIHRASASLAHWLSSTVVDPTSHPTLGDGGVRSDASHDVEVVSVESDASLSSDAGESAEQDAQSPEDSALDVVDMDASDAAVVDESIATDAGSNADAASDAVAVADVPVDDDPDEDAGLALQPFVGTPSAAGLTMFAEIDSCRPRAIWMGQLSAGGPDEVVVTCDDAVRVYYLQNDSLLERTVFRPVIAAGTLAFLSRAVVADFDGDGQRDLGLCMYVTSDRGGTRGGNSWWARGRFNGQFEAPRTLVAGFDCGGIEFGDVTGDGRPELILIKEGNGYAPTNPESQMFWYEGNPSRLTTRGHVRLSKGAGGVWLEDLTNDNILDVIVHTGWDGERRNWVIAGARRGPSGVVPNIETNDNENRLFVTPQGRLDSDNEADAVRVGPSQQLEFYRSTPWNRPVLESATPALDREEFPLR